MGVEERPGNPLGKRPPALWACQTGRKEGHHRLDRTRAKCVPQLSQLIRTSLTDRALLKLLRPGTVLCGWGGG